MKTCIGPHDAPVEAKFGFLCPSHFGRVQRALDGDESSDDFTFKLGWPSFTRIIIAHGGRMVMPELEGNPGGFESTVPGMVMVRDAIDTVEAELFTLSLAGGDLKQWICRDEWAVDALAFARKSYTFRCAHPISERDRRMKPSHWRCPSEHCRVVNPDPELLVIQPRQVGGVVSERAVQCAFCGHVLSMDEAVRLATEEQWRNERLGSENA